MLWSIQAFSFCDYWNSCTRNAHYFALLTFYPNKIWHRKYPNTNGWWCRCHNSGLVSPFKYISSLKSGQYQKIINLNTSNIALFETQTKQFQVRHVVDPIQSVGCSVVFATLNLQWETLDFRYQLSFFYLLLSLFPVRSKNGSSRRCERNWIRGLLQSRRSRSGRLPLY